MTVVPVPTLVTVGTPVVTDISPGGGVGMGSGKICGGSVENAYKQVAMLLVAVIMRL